MMRTRSMLLIVGVICSFPVCLIAAEPKVEKIWPDTPPGPHPFVDGPEKDTSNEQSRKVAGRRVIRLGNVASAEMHLYPAPKDKATGAACIICPGGGFSILAWDLEGTEVARWLNDIGVTAIVLKYRVPTRQHGPDKNFIGPVMDAQRTICIVRYRAKELGVDPQRIGILGFSAGGETAAKTALYNGRRLYDRVDDQDKTSCAANFAILVYPAGIVTKDGELKVDVPITEKMPPMFFAHAADDQVLCEHSLQLYLALRKTKQPNEIHIYPTGGHGYGLRFTKDRVTRWPSDAGAWLKEIGMLTSSK